MSWMMGKGCCFCQMILFSLHRSLTQCTLPSFFGVIKVGKLHLLDPCWDKTPIATRCLSSFLKAARCMHNIVYGLARFVGLAPGYAELLVRVSYSTSLPVNRHGKSFSTWFWLAFCCLSKCEHWSTTSSVDTGIWQCGSYQSTSQNPKYVLQYL